MRQQLKPAGPAVVDSNLSDALASGDVVATLDVSLSNEIVHLLSEQLYTSPLKAIEELVVNSYDADAAECRIALLFEGAPAVALVSDDEEDAESTAEEDETAPNGLIAIYDDGEGMDLTGLQWLWRIGDSPKTDLISPTQRFGRKAVGKFGIGKLATYAVANRITYISANGGIIRYVLCDFRRFGPNATGGASEPVKLLVRVIFTRCSVRAFSLDILDADAAPGPQAPSRLVDAAKKPLVVFESVIEPVVLGPEADQHPGSFPVPGDDNLLFFCLAQKSQEVVLDFRIAEPASHRISEFP